MGRDSHYLCSNNLKNKFWEYLNSYHENEFPLFLRYGWSQPILGMVNFCEITRTQSVILSPESIQSHLMLATMKPIPEVAGLSLRFGDCIPKKPLIFVCNTQNPNLVKFHWPRKGLRQSRLSKTFKTSLNVFFQRRQSRWMVWYGGSRHFPRLHWPKQSLRYHWTTPIPKSHENHTVWVTVRGTNVLRSDYLTPRRTFR